MQLHFNEGEIQMTDLLLLGAVVAVAAAISGFQFIRERQIVPDEPEWLGTMNRVFFISPAQIAEEMSKRKEARVRETVARKALRSLEAKKFVECGTAMENLSGENILVMGYRLTHSGLIQLIAGNSARHFPEA